MAAALVFIFTVVSVSFMSVSVLANDIENLECHGKTYKNVTLAAYYPEYDEELAENGTTDVRGKKLRNLQDFLDDRADYVTLAMDATLKIPYGTPACIPELNRHCGRRVRLQVRDAGSDLRGRKYRRADICVRAETDSYDRHVNQLVTLVF